MLLSRLRSAPISLSLATATAKTAAADALTQRCIEGRPAIDTRRTALFTVFGFYYLGGFQYWLYVRCFARWFPSAKRFGEHATIADRCRDAVGLRELAAQTFLGNFVHIPLVFFPCFYVTQELITNGAAPQPQHAPVATALRRYRDNAWDDLRSAWAIWVPGHAIFFAVPLWLRLPLNHAMSFAFVCVLSLTRGGGG